MTRPLPRNQALPGDARTRLRRLPNDSADMVLTSPPYFRLRDYQTPGQLGLEDSIAQWVNALREVCAEIARVLVPTGTLWLNLGDTYSTHLRQGAPKKSLLLGPERLALALLADGWIIRNKIVWAKPNAIPSPVRDRLATTYEFVYLLSRSRHYFFDLDAIRVAHTSRPPGSKAPASPTPRETWRGPNSDGTGGLRTLKAAGRAGHPLGKNPGDVWTLPTAGLRGGHHAAFPLRLAERAITAGCPERRCSRCRLPWRRTIIRAIGGTAVREALTPTCQCHTGHQPGLVLDPFMGSGTTAIAAEALGRNWLGIELSPAYVALAEQRIAAARGSPGEQQRQAPLAPAA